MGSRYERLLKLEERALEQRIELTPQQVAQIEKANPAFKERHVESSRPGELLSQDTFYVGTLKLAFRTTFYETVEALQMDLDAWLVEYNTQRPHQGYRNRSRRPWDAIQDYLKQRQPFSSPAAASQEPGA